MGGYVVEEEIPSQKKDEFMQGEAPNINGPHNETTGIDWDD
jgi:hypothetical protein